MKFNSKDSAEEIYSHVINVTINSIRKYLRRKKKYNILYDIPQELEKRWRERMQCMRDQVDTTWNRFQDPPKKLTWGNNKKPGLAGVKNSSNFQAVCALSNILFFRLRLSKLSSFKLWLLNCLISGFSYDGFCPFKTLLIKSKFTPTPFSTLSQGYMTENFNHFTDDRFEEYKLLASDSSTNFDIWAPSKNIKKLSNCKGILNGEKESNYSEIEPDSNPQSETQENSCHNFILSIADRVYRRNNKWRVLLKDGILNVNGNDLLFNSCRCEFSW